MIRFFYRLFNHDKIEDLERTISIYKERNQQLEEEVREYKGYKLKYDVTKLYVEDDDALLELLDYATKKANEPPPTGPQEYLRHCQQQGLANMQAQRMGQLGQAQSLFGGIFGN